MLKNHRTFLDQMFRKCLYGAGIRVHERWDGTNSVGEQSIHMDILKHAETLCTGRFWCTIIPLAAGCQSKYPTCFHVCLAHWRLT